MASALQLLAFSNRVTIPDFRPVDRQFANVNEAYATAHGGAFGRTILVEWLPPSGDGRQVMLKVLLGPQKGRACQTGQTTLDDFFREETVLKEARNPDWASRVDAVGVVAPCAAGVGHLCFTYCSGAEEDARVNLSSCVPLGAPCPVFMVAMEPLMGGTLWGRLGLAPSDAVPVYVGIQLDPLAALWAAADLMAGLSALHELGYAHADLKCVPSDNAIKPHRITFPGPLPSFSPTCLQGRQPAL
jgi:serine/threonine protein kinase